jgi:hypothetical protein
MTKDPTKAKAFKQTLGNLLKMPPKPQADMKVGKRKPQRVGAKTPPK